MYETVLSLPLLLVLIFVGIQLMVTGYRSVVLQFAAAQGVRMLALGMCDGEKLHPDGGTVLNPGMAGTPNCPLGTINVQEERAKYAYNFARLVAARFGLKTRSDDDSKKNFAAACVLPLSDPRLDDASAGCRGLTTSSSHFDGVPGQVGNNAPIGALQIRTSTGIGIFAALQAAGTDFRNQQRDYIWAFAIARMEF